MSKWSIGISGAPLEVFGLFCVLVRLIFVGVPGMHGTGRSLGVLAVAAGVTMWLLFSIDGVSVWSTAMITLRMCVAAVG